MASRSSPACLVTKLLSFFCKFLAIQFSHIKLSAQACALSRFLKCPATSLPPSDNVFGHEAFFNWKIPPPPPYCPILLWKIPPGPCLFGHLRPIHVAQMFMVDLIFSFPFLFLSLQMYIDPLTDFFPGLRTLIPLSPSPWKIRCDTKPGKFLFSFYVQRVILCPGGPCFTTLCRLFG